MKVLLNIKIKKRDIIWLVIIYGSNQCETKPYKSVIEAILQLIYNKIHKNKIHNYYYQMSCVYVHRLYISRSIEWKKGFWSVAKLKIFQVRSFLNVKEPFNHVHLTSSNGISTPGLLEVSRRFCLRLIVW